MYNVSLRQKDQLQLWNLEKLEGLWACLVARFWFLVCLIMSQQFYGDNPISYHANFQHLLKSMFMFHPAETQDFKPETAIKGFKPETFCSVF